VKKIARQTARVHWHMGQALLPEHFYAQEQALREEIGLRLRLTGPPAFGLASLAWDEYQLQKGMITLQEMTLILPSGILVDIPGNTSPAFLNLASSGANKVSVYVHLQSAYETATTYSGGPDDGGVERVIQKVELSIEPYSATGSESFRLAQLECAADGTWSVDSRYVPALLQVGNEPFFKPYAERCTAVANALRHSLLDEVKENYLASEGQSPAKQCLRGLFAFIAFLGDLNGEIRPHPYEVFSAIRSLYFDVCVFRGVHPAALDRIYEHEDLAASLDALLSELEQQVQIRRQTLPYSEFVRQEGMLACKLGKDTRKARDVYLLVQKPSVASKLDLGRVKLASQSRINLVHERALRGIAFQRLDNPPFHHGLSSTVDFFTITHGEEWDYAVAEGNVVLFETPGLKDCRLYLYWRNE
jgi:type VI secretion system protein ImpJ